MRMQTWLGALLAAAVGVGLAGCGGEPAPASEPTVTDAGGVDTSDTDEAGTEQTQDGDVGSGTVSIPDGAREASADFPFPVPADWPELRPFSEEETGGSMAMSAGYEFPGDAEAAAALYADLLRSAGYEVYDFPNPGFDASFLVDGTVNGTPYGGGVMFQHNADGSQVANVILTESDDD